MTAGLGSEIKAGASEYSVLTDSKGAFTPTGAAVFGAGSYASGVAAAEVTGQPEHFSWAGVAASAVSAGVTAKAGLQDGALQKLGQATDSSFAANVAGGLLSGGIRRGTSLMLGDGHVSSWKSIGQDAFGNALGNAVLGAINSYEANKIPAIDTSVESIDIASATVNVANIPQSIAPVGLGQSTFPTNAAQGQDSVSWKAPGYVSTSASMADATTLPAVTVHGDGTVSVATDYTPAEEAEFQRTYTAAVANQQMAREAEQVNRSRANTAQAAQKLSQRIYDQRQADGRAFVSIMPKALLGAGKDLVNGVDWLGESLWKEAQLQTGLALGEYSGTDGVVGQLLTDATTPITPLFDLDPVERAGSYAFAALSIGDAGLTLAGKAPELISSAGRFFDGLRAEGEMAQTFPELSVGKAGVPNSVGQMSRDEALLSQGRSCKRCARSGFS